MKLFKKQKVSIRAINPVTPQDWRELLSQNGTLITVEMKPNKLGVTCISRYETHFGR